MTEPTTPKPAAESGTGAAACSAILKRLEAEAPRCSCCGRRIIVASADDLADPTQCEAEISTPNR